LFVGTITGFPAADVQASAICAAANFDTVSGELKEFVAAK
jgi:hypothetical protein